MKEGGKCCKSECNKGECTPGACAKCPCTNCECGRKFCPFSLGIALGVVTAIGMLILGWIAGSYDWSRPMVDVLGSVYYGFKPGFVGGIVGAVFGFIDGFISGFIIGVVYNLCMRGKCCRYKCCRYKCCWKKCQAEKQLEDQAPTPKDQE